MASSSDAPEGIFPSASGVLPFWRTDLHPLDAHRSTPELPPACDVVIIGAGAAGISTAYHLLDEDVGKPSLVMLEARQACSGATARNGGHIRPQIYRNVLKHADIFGMKSATEIAEFEAAHLPALQALVEREQIDCDWTPTRTFDLTTDDKIAEYTKSVYDELAKQSPGRMASVLYDGPETAEKASIPTSSCPSLTMSRREIIYSSNISKVSGIKGAKCCFSLPSATLWVYKLMMSLLQRAVDRGLNLQTHTPVIRISDNPDREGYWSVHTSRGTLKTKKVILTTNAYTAGLASQYSGKIVPSRGICSRVIVPQGAPHPPLTTPLALWLGGTAIDYVVPRDDGSIIIGGARSTFFDDRSLWYNVVDDATLIKPAEKYFDEYMQSKFTGWEDSGAYTDQVWTGIMGYTSDAVPHIGAVPGKEGQFIAAGFNGHGNPVIFLAAKGIARMVRDGIPFEDTGIPSAFKTTQQRLDSNVDHLQPQNIKV
ncbi:MAG: hypothetical protein M1818_007653 [Claussenomyces sp. TS43310]|nr:MAG: hypothetical protein M1818_007653 [Claussenomyces sp. TS43310]